MGLGDFIMSTADIREAHKRTGKKVKVGDGYRLYVEDQVYRNNPRLAAKNEEDCVWVDNYPNHRPYIKKIEGKRIIFNDGYSPEPGEIYLTDQEYDWRDNLIPKTQYIVIEPNVKNKYQHSVNKSWPYWDQLAAADMPWIQLGDINASPKFPYIQTDTFRQALAILSGASLFVGTDGGLHHAAAALGIPAVVIWTGFTSPVHLGYKDHINIHNGEEPCGYFGGVCQHCKKISHSITPEQVMKEVNEEYTRSVAARSRRTLDPVCNP